MEPHESERGGHLDLILACTIPLVFVLALFTIRKCIISKDHDDMAAAAEAESKLGEGKLGEAEVSSPPPRAVAAGIYAGPAVAAAM